MLDYGWENPSTIILTGDELTQDSDQSRQIFDHNINHTFDDNLINPNNGFTSHHYHHFHHPQTQNTHFQSIYGTQTYGSASYPPPSPAMLSLEPVTEGRNGFMVVPKSEQSGADFTSRIGLNLGGRTYFSSEEDDFVNHLYRRSRQGESGSVNFPRCQAEGCNADLTHAKHYHRRHKVCEFHSKAATVIAGGITQRFCQQCSRFHLLSEFDNGKRSCRKRLADHNRRRRKSHQLNQDHKNARFQSDSGARSSSSVTIAISPPRISLDSLGPRTYDQTPTSSSSLLSTSSHFFSNV